MLTQTKQITTYFILTMAACLCTMAYAKADTSLALSSVFSDMPSAEQANSYLKGTWESYTTLPDRSGSVMVIKLMLLPDGDFTMQHIQKRKKKRKTLKTLNGSWGYTPDNHQLMLQTQADVIQVSIKHLDQGELVLNSLLPEQQGKNQFFLKI